MYGTRSSSRQKITFWTFPDVCRPSNLITSFSRCFGSAVERTHAYWPSPAARLIGDGVHLDFGVDDRTRLDGGASQHRIFEVLGEHPVVSAEVARIVEIRGDAHNIGEHRTLFRENSANRFDRTLRLVLDRSGDHIPVGILGDLPGDEDEVTGANGRIEWQSRVLLSNRVYILLAAARVVHRTDLIRMPWFQ